MAGPSAIDRVVAGLMGYEPEKVILFGSLARGETDEFSDIDLIVIKDTEERFFQRLLDVTAYLPRDVTIDALVYTPGEIEAMVKGGNPFIQQALEEGQVLYEKPPGGGEGNVAPPWEKPIQKGRSFVKEALLTARRWLAQAEHSLTATQALLEAGFAAEACFHAEQTAQLALKAFLYARGRRRITIHSVLELAQQCAAEDGDFSPLVEYGGTLDRYYLSTRYPDALPAPAVPFESFTDREARQALGYATEIVELVRAKVPGAPGQLG